MNYATGLAAAAEQAGARIFEHTPALSLDPAGIRKRIVTPSARVRATHIVLAGNTGLGALMPRLAASLLPITTYVATTEPLGDKLKEAITYTGAVSDSMSADSHYRIIDGDRLMWAGGMTMWMANPKRYARRLAADIRRVYPQLGRVALDHVWSGTLGRAVHKMPQIGEISRGVWIASGFGGHGFNTTAMAGELIARGIVEADQNWRLFSSYDLVWAGGAAGRGAMQAVYWARRIRERLAAQFNHPAEMRQEASLPLETAPPVAAAEAPAATAPEPEVAQGALQPVSTKKKAVQRRRQRAKKRATGSAIVGDDGEPNIVADGDAPAAAAGRVPAER
jgi:hypothetical protein